jgi:hypothetical protein
MNVASLDWNLCSSLIHLVIRPILVNLPALRCHDAWPWPVDIILQVRCEKQLQVMVRMLFLTNNDWVIIFPIKIMPQAMWHLWEKNHYLCNNACKGQVSKPRLCADPEKRPRGVHCELLGRSK